MDLSDSDYAALASFRAELRRFLRFSEEEARDAGLTVQQYQALLAIRAAPERSMLVGELATELGIRPHSATELVDRLSRLDLIERGMSGGDRRRVLVSLTPKAGELLLSLAGSHRNELQRVRPLLLDLMGRL